MNGTTLTTWIIVPHEPLIFRDGKPFSATPGARAASVPFPFPSTLAGAVRTLSGALANNGEFPTGDKRVIQQVQAYRVVGPFLFDQKQKELLFPAPQDALLLKLEPYNEHREDDLSLKAKRVPLQPTTRFQDVLTNLPEGLHLVAPIVDSKAKPHPHTPVFWHWSEVKAWLEHPQHGVVSLDTLGIEALPVDYRMHVSIQGESSTAKEGALFQTAGLTFVHAPQPAALSEAAELGLLVQTNAPLQTSLDTLGGERRVVSWESANPKWLPSCPDAVRKAILTTRRGRLILATPAHFEQGFLPRWVCKHPSGVKLRIVGAAVGRPVHVSGWNYEEHTPKPSRRLAPAGSVYFFKIEAGDEAAMERFIEETWLHPISDEPQDRRDGFGVALLGAWNPEEA